MIYYIMSKVFGISVSFDLITLLCSFRDSALVTPLPLGEDTP